MNLTFKRISIAAANNVCLVFYANKGWTKCKLLIVHYTCVRIVASTGMETNLMDGVEFALNVQFTFVLHSTRGHAKNTGYEIHLVERIPPARWEKCKLLLVPAMLSFSLCWLSSSELLSEKQFLVLGWNAYEMFRRWACKSRARVIIPSIWNGKLLAEGVGRAATVWPEILWRLGYFCFG